MQPGRIRRRPRSRSGRIRLKQHDEPVAKDLEPVAVGCVGQVPRPPGPVLGIAGQRRPPAVTIRLTGRRIEVSGRLAVADSAARPGRAHARHEIGCPVHCRADSLVAAAPADLAGQRLVDRGVARPRIAIQQGGGYEDHAGGAVAALRGRLLAERPLDRIQLAAGSEALDRRDRLSGRRLDRPLAGPDWLAVEQHGARAARALAAARLRPGQAKAFPHRSKQRHRPGEFGQSPVDLDGDIASHGSAAGDGACDQYPGPE